MGWAVLGDGNTRVTSFHPKQKGAIETAREIAKRNLSEVVIQIPDGRIRDKDSYGNDPSSIKDTKY